MKPLPDMLPLINAGLVSIAFEARYKSLGTDDWAYPRIAIINYETDFEYFSIHQDGNTIHLSAVDYTNKNDGMALSLRSWPATGPSLAFAIDVCTAVARELITDNVTSIHWDE